MTRKDLKDRFSSAFSELEEKNPFVCVSCGEAHHDVTTHDRFSEASLELEDKNAYVCKSCGGKMIPEREHESRGRKVEGRSHNPALELARSRTEETINSDPTPFGV